MVNSKSVITLVFSPLASRHHTRHFLLLDKLSPEVERTKEEGFWLLPRTDIAAAVLEGNLGRWHTMDRRVTRPWALPELILRL